MNLLDNGYIKIVEFWGSDERIIEAARMSTAKGFLGWNSDYKLLKYLYNNKHMTPFEMCGLIVEVQAPIFVFREWHRHRTQSYNELSARYTELPDLFYIPTAERLENAGSKSNKQAQGSAVYNNENTTQVLCIIDNHSRESRSTYIDLLRLGVPRELARLVIPVNQYSRMRASANLRNWLQFLELRLPENAQWEIRQYAECLLQLIKECFPKTWELFNENRTNKSS